MHNRLVQEYRIWREELLEILRELYEDVVPAGRIREDGYWRTKALYNAYHSNERDAFLLQLLQYGVEGRAVLAAVKSEIATVGTGKLSFLKAGKAEEMIFRLRRTHASSVLSSLQALTNFAFLAESCMKSQEDNVGEADDVYNRKIYQELGIYFEIDDSDEVKRIRSGVLVAERVQTAQVKQYRTRGQRTEEWNHPVAG